MESNQAVLAKRLHQTYKVQQFDNGDIWAGNPCVLHGEAEHRGDLIRFFHPGPGKRIRVRISAELFIRDITEQEAGLEGLVARLWTDIDDHGYMDQKGVYHPGFGRYHPMKLVTDSAGFPVLNGSNVIFITDEIEIAQCGVYNFTVEFSADGRSADDPARPWLSLSEIAFNKDGTIVVSPGIVASCPSIMEVCLRKYGAMASGGGFISGTFNNLTENLDRLPVQVIYLLPFFLPGTADRMTGEDVRKGELGSIYAIRDFYRIDPALCSPVGTVDIREYVSEELVTEYDMDDLLTGKQQEKVKRTGDLSHFRDMDELASFLGEETLLQLTGRAELRRLVRKAHELGKRVIFDMVIMQTSRDNDLIKDHLDWYQLDENGHPSKHRIAWLDYSDVALFRLTFNKPLQSYLTSVAAYWIKTCDLDGIRIDAAQTVDRPFLKQLSNRIHKIKPDAIILGETLCPIHEAVDVTTDMVYSLLVDHHIHSDSAKPFIDLFEHYHSSFARRTVAIAYFENHDSRRGTRAWHDKFNGLYAGDPDFRQHWEEVSRRIYHGDGELPQDFPGYTAALIRNIQASAINATCGSADGVRFAPCIEMGTEYGEESRTDFENSTLLYPHLADQEPHRSLRRAYVDLEELRRSEPLLHEGRVYYFRENLQGGTDRILCYARYDEARLVLCAFNLDPSRRQEGAFDLEKIPVELPGTLEPKILFDSYSRFGNSTHQRLPSTGAQVELESIPVQHSDKSRPVLRSVLKLSLPPLAAYICKVG